MQDTDIINLWKLYDKKLEASLVVNKKNTEEITKLKVQSLLASMKPIKVFTIIVGLLWVGLVDFLLINVYPIANPFFLVSIGLQVLLTKMAIVVYLYQLILIQKADISEPVLATQEKLSRLKSSTLWVARLLFLQLPLWTTFYWNKSMLTNGNMWLYALQIMITVSFACVALWLFFNIKFENRNKKWFRLIFNGKEWTPVIKSMDLLSQVNDYKDVPSSN